MEPGDILSPAQTGLNLGTVFLNHHWQKEQLEQNEQWAREDAATAYNRQVEQWNRENAYNTPSAIMRRYLDAGLNPMLAVGEGLNNGNIGAPSVPQATSASGNSYYAPTDAGNFLSQALLKSQIAKTNAEAERVQSELPLIDAQTRATLKDLGVKDSLMLYYINLAKVCESDYARNMGQVSLMNEQQRQLWFDNEFSEKTFDKRVEQFSLDFQMSKDKAERFVRILESSIAQAYSIANVNNATAELHRAEIPLQNALIEYYKALSNKTGIEASLVELQRAYEAYYGDTLRKAQIFHLVNFGESVNFKLGPLEIGGTTPTHTWHQNK